MRAEVQEMNAEDEARQFSSVFDPPEALLNCRAQRGTTFPPIRTNAVRCSRRQTAMLPRTRRMVPVTSSRVLTTSKIVALSEDRRRAGGLGRARRADQIGMGSHRRSPSKRIAARQGLARAGATPSAAFSGPRASRSLSTGFPVAFDQRLARRRRPRLGLPCLSRPPEASRTSRRRGRSAEKGRRVQFGS